jgi:hypothetical protein
LKEKVPAFHPNCETNKQLNKKQNKKSKRQRPHSTCFDVVVVVYLALIWRYVQKCKGRLRRSLSLSFVCVTECAILTQGNKLFTKVSIFLARCPFSNKQDPRARRITNPFCYLKNLCEILNKLLKFKTFYRDWRQHGVLFFFSFIEIFSTAVEFITKHAEKKNTTIKKSTHEPREGWKWHILNKKAQNLFWELMNSAGNQGLLMW